MTCVLDPLDSKENAQDFQPHYSDSLILLQNSMLQRLRLPSNTYTRIILSIEI